MINNNNFNLKKAFSIVELMISLAILITIGLMMVTMVTKKMGGAVNDITGEEYTCYRDSENKLHQRVTIYRANGRTETKEKDDVYNCSHKLSERATNATIYLVGGGGGGGGISDSLSPTVSYYGYASNFPKNWKYDKINLQTNIDPIPECSDKFYYFNTHMHRAGYADCYNSLYGCGIVQPTYLDYNYSINLPGHDYPQDYFENLVNHNKCNYRDPSDLCKNTTHVYCNYYDNYNDEGTTKIIPRYVIGLGSNNRGYKGIRSTTVPLGMAKPLENYMNDDLYNRKILNNAVVTIYGGGKEDYPQNYQLQLTTDSHFFCINGQEAKVVNEDRGSYPHKDSPGNTGNYKWPQTADQQKFHISPSPGVIYADGYVIFASGGEWNSFNNIPNLNNCSYKYIGYEYRGYEYGNNLHNFYNYYNYGTAANVAKPYYQYTLYRLKEVQMPYGTIGKAGKTLEIKNVNLSGKKVVLPSAGITIGNGGAGGPYEQKSGTKTSIIYNGKSGTATKYKLTETINNETKTTTYSASGGSGGKATNSTMWNLLTDTSSTPNKFIYDESDPTNACAYDTTTNTPYVFQSNYNESGEISDYISRNQLKGRSRYAAATYKYDENDELIGNVARKDSFGAGGAGINSKLLYYSSYIFGLTKTTYNYNTTSREILVGLPGTNNDNYKLCSQIKFYPEFTDNNRPNNNGNGGAIIIKWGDALK